MHYEGSFWIRQELHSRLIIENKPTRHGPPESSCVVQQCVSDTDGPPRVSMNPQGKGTVLSKSVPLRMSATGLGIPRPPALWSQLATNSGVPSNFLRLDGSLEWLKKALYLKLHGYKLHLGFPITSQTNFLGASTWSIQTKINRHTR